MPLPKKAKDADEDVKSMSIFDAVRGKSIALEDLALKKGYNLRSASASSATYNDLIVELGPISNPFSNPFSNRWQNEIQT